MTTNPEDIVSDALIDALAPGVKAARVTRLLGGVSAQSLALALTRGDDTVERLVVRHRPASSAWGSRSTAQEYALLAALQSSRIPVPRPRLMWSDETMVMAWVEGTSELPRHGPSVMAEMLALVHAQRGMALEGLAEREDPTPVLERYLADVGLGSAAQALPPFGAGERCLLHGDYWPGNLLWRDGELVAVLDWEDAAVGDPLSDVACARAELEVAAGRQAAATFTERYLAATGRDAQRLVWWDVYVSTTALDSMDLWGLPAEVLEARRGATLAFRDRALAALRRLHGGEP